MLTEKELQKRFPVTMSRVRQEVGYDIEAYTPGNVHPTNPPLMIVIWDMIRHFVEEGDIAGLALVVDDFCDAVLKPRYPPPLFFARNKEFRTALQGLSLKGPPCVACWKL